MRLLFPVARIINNIKIRIGKNGKPPNALNTKLTKHSIR